MLLKFFTSSLFSLFLVDRLLQKDVAAVEADVDVTYVQLFSSGVEAYRTKEWGKCIDFFSRAVDDYKFYRNQITTCRRKCHTADKEASYLTNATDVENRFFEIGIKHTLCLVNCRKTHFRGRPNVYTAEIDDVFERLIPYNYLQVCYFEHGDLDRAMTAAFTFLHANPGHQDMQHNIDFYNKEKGADKKHLRNIEPKEYQDLFLTGIKAFDGGSSNSVLDYIGRALDAYIEAEENCRAMCEGSFDQDGMQPDLYIAVANHMTYALKCRRKCPIRLQTFDGNIDVSASLFSRHYFYLEVAYEKLDQVEEACHAVESYLLFNPKDEKMLKAKEALKDLPDVQDDWFTPRPEALTYYEREKTETELLAYIEKEFDVLVKENAADRAKLNVDGSGIGSSPAAPVGKKTSKKNDDGIKEEKPKTEQEDFAF